MSYAFGYVWGNEQKSQIRNQMKNIKTLIAATVAALPCLLGLCTNNGILQAMALCYAVALWVWCARTVSGRRALLALYRAALRIECALF